MPATVPAGRVLRFGVFELHVATGVLRKHGIKLKLRPQAAKVLVLLVTRPGEVVTREQLKDEIWGRDFFVDFEHGLNLCISQIRGALDDDADRPRYIETLPRRGYRFVGHLDEAVADSRTSPAAPTPTNTQIQPDQDQRAKPKGLARWRRLLVGAAALVTAVTILLLAFPGLRGRLRPGVQPQRIQSLAVLPLEDLSHDAEQEYFADGMTDELITNLAKIRALRVISRNSVMQYKNKHKAPPQIARELNIEAIVEGTVMRAGDRVRITAQLIDARSDRHLWADTYEGDLRDVLVLQDEVAGAIAREIKVQLLPEESSGLASAPSVNREAFELYLKGRYFWNRRNTEGLNKALDYFQQAAEKDPGYAPAQAGLADTYSLLGSAGYDVLPAAEAKQRAREAAQKALHIDDTLAEAHASLAFVIYSYDWDWTTAEREFKRAIALNPNYPTARQWYSELLNDLGRKEEALAQAQAALALDPLSLNANHNVARVLYFARRMDQAIEITQKTLEMDSNFAIGHLRLGRAYAAKGKYAQAIEEFREFARLSGDVPLATASIGNALGRSGDRSGASRALNELAMLSKHKRVPSICFALIHTGLGNNDQAMIWLEKAYRERSDFLLVLKVDPLFDSIRADPRFQDLVHRIGLIG